MRAKPLPSHRVIKYTLPGNRNYVCHAIEVRGVRIHSQIGPYGQAEVAERVRAYVNPPPPPPPMAKMVRGAGRPSRVAKEAKAKYDFGRDGHPED